MNTPVSGVGEAGYIVIRVGGGNALKYFRPVFSSIPAFDAAAPNVLLFFNMCSLLT